VLLYSRELDIVDYGDLKTKDRIQYQIQQVAVILGCDMYSNWGKVIDLLTNKFTLIKVSKSKIYWFTISLVQATFRFEQRS